MKYSLTVLACAMSALMASSAFAAPKITGRLYAAMLYQDQDVKTTNLATGAVTNSEAGKRTQFNSGGSRIRFEGTETLNDKLDLVYRLEYSVFLDNDARTATGHNNFAARTTYLGVNHKDYGKFLAGRMYTPDDDIDYVNAGFLYADGAQPPFHYQGQRTNNTLRYESPKLGANKKTSFTVHYAMDEGHSNPAGLANGATTSRTGDLAVANVFHDGDKLKWGAAYTHGGDDLSSIRAMASYDVNDKLKVGAMVQHTDYNTSDNEFGVFASANYKYQPDLDIYGQVGFADKFGGYKDGENLVASTGVVKWLKKEGGTRVRLFGSVNYSDKTALEGGNKVQTDGFGLETGIRYDF